MSSLLVRRRGKKAAQPAELPAPADGASGTGSPWAGGPDQPATPPSSSGGGDDGEDPPPQVVEWSNGPALITKAWGALLALALLAGPAALVWTVLRPAPAPVAATAGAESSAEQAAASERAVELVETWLRADSDDKQLLASLTNAPVGSLPQEGLTIRDSSVAQVEQADDGVWSVTVGVDVAEPAPGSSPPPGGAEADKQAEVPLVWVRRYFQVPVLVDRTDTKWSGADLAVTALALPAPVPGPAAAADPPGLDYPETISPTSAAGQSVAGFLAAMVAGDGEITRYLRPGTSISAIAPAPYAAVAVTGIKGSHEVAEDPADDAGTHALTTVELERLDGEKTTAQYVLTLVARDGRWEVAGVEPAVRIDTTPTGTTDSGSAGE